MTVSRMKSPLRVFRVFRGDQLTGTGDESAAITSLNRYFAPSMPFSGPASYSRAKVPLKPPASMILVDRCTSFLSPHRSQYLAWQLVCEYGASALRPLNSMYSCSQLQKSGDASQYG